MRQIEILARALATAESGDASTWRLYSAEARIAAQVMRSNRRDLSVGATLLDQNISVSD